MKNIFRLLFSFFIRILGSNRSVLNAADKAIGAVNFIKLLVNDPTLNFVVARSKTEIDDKILAALKKIILKLFPDTIESKEIDLVTAEFIAKIKDMPIQMQHALYFKIASEIFGTMYSRKALSESQRDTIIQLAYSRG